jgi:hypothetical protein
MSRSARHGAAYSCIIMDSSKPIAQAAIYPLGAEPPDDLSATTSIEERFPMSALALETWCVSGRTLHGNRRATISSGRTS